MEELINVNEISLNFNLREPKGNKATNVYAIVRIGTIQMKIPTGCKVNSWQWNKKKQSPDIYKAMSRDDSDNNLRVNKMLSQIKIEFLNYYSYLCTSFETVTVIELKKNLHKIIGSISYIKVMNDENLCKSVKKASTLLEKAFNLYYCEFHPNVAESTKKKEKSHIDSFISYCENKGVNNSSSLSRTGVMGFQRYLIDKSKTSGGKGDSNMTINNKCKSITKYINFMAAHDDFQRYNISKFDYINLVEVKAKGTDKKRRPLKINELKALLDLNDLNDKEKEFRDLFVLQCNAGYRISDTPKLFNPSLQKTFHKDGFDYITIIPQKEEKKKIIAVIWLNDIIKTILDRYKNGFKYIDFTKYNANNFRHQFNANLRRICEKAKLDSIEHWTDANGNSCEDKLYNIIGSHFARYTFIYNGLFHYGFTPNELKDFTGHIDDKMINEVYSIYSEEDKVAEANKALNRVMAKGASNSTTPQKSAIANPLNDLFAYDSFISIIDLMNSNNDVFHLDSTKQAIKVMKDISKLNSYSKDADVSKVIELEQVIFELSYYFRDPLLYSVFKHKEHYFGMEVVVPNTEEVEMLFAQEDFERPKRCQQIQLEEWENNHK